MTDGYLIYNEQATPKTDTETVTRTIHYVPSNDHTKRLQDDTTQSVTFKGTAYTDAKGNLVNAKQVKDAAGKNVWVVKTDNTAIPKETWTVDTTATNTGLTTDDKDFAAVSSPATITLSDTDAQTRRVKSGYWNYVDGASQAALFKADGTPVTNLADGYVEYNQDETTQTKTVNETIHYVMSDGSQAPADYNATALTFTRTGTKDKKGNTIWGAWTKSQDFASHKSPDLTGYTPDVATVLAINVTVGTSDQGLNGTDTDVTVNGDSTDPATVTRTVIYTANDQTATINYIDDTTGKTIRTDTATGKYNAAIDFTTKPSDQIAAYEKAGYVLVSNDFKSTDTYQADNSKNVFNVHLTHGTETVTRDHPVTQTVHYVMSDGSKAPSDNVQKLTFHETGTDEGQSYWKYHLE